MKNLLFLFILLIASSVSGQILYFGQQSSTGTQWTGMISTYSYKNNFASDEVTPSADSYLDTIYVYSTANNDDIGIGLIRESDGVSLWNDTIASTNNNWMAVYPTPNTIEMVSTETYSIFVYDGGASTFRGQYTVETAGLGYDASLDPTLYEETDVQNLRLSMYGAYHAQGEASAAPNKRRKVQEWIWSE